MDRNFWMTYNLPYTSYTKQPLVRVVSLLTGEAKVEIGYKDVRIEMLYRIVNARVIRVPNLLVITTFSIPALIASRKMWSVPSFAVCS